MLKIARLMATCLILGTLCLPHTPSSLDSARLYSLLLANIRPIAYLIPFKLTFRDPPAIKYIGYIAFSNGIRYR